MRDRILPLVMFVIFIAIVLVSLQLVMRQQYLELLGGQYPPTLSDDDILALNNIFTDQPFMGGQNPPMMSKWVNENAFIFFQFSPDAGNTLRYVGIGTKGVFCQQLKDTAFTSFHRWSVSSYAEGIAGQPGDLGYWLMRASVDNFNDNGRHVPPGTDYAFDPTPAPECSNVPNFDITVPSRKISRQDIALAISLFKDVPFDHVQPRVMKMVNDRVFVFMQFDTTGREELKYMGMGVRGKFCKGSQPSGDFSHFQGLVAGSYLEGFGGAPGGEGYWLMFMPVDNFQDGARPVYTGVDRYYEKTEAPDCLW